jgi:hypothetical protein
MPLRDASPGVPVSANVVGTDQSTGDEKKVTVCDACLRACCWQGEFYCEDYKHAGTVEKTVAELRKLRLENEHYWRDLDGTGQPAKTAGPHPSEAFNDEAAKRDAELLNGTGQPGGDDPHDKYAGELPYEAAGWKPEDE